MTRRVCLAAATCLLAGITASAAPAGTKFTVPVTYYKLPNGLRVVLSEDHTAPTVVVAVYYNIGFRNEPKDRTGFAHLFEHMMFQGSKNLGKMEIERLRREAPSEKELAGFERNMAGLFVLQNSNPGGIIGQLSFVDLHGLGDTWLNTYVQRVNAVKPSDVQRRRIWIRRR